VAETIRYAGANLYPKQRAAIFDEARISIIEASTKSGKTVGCLAWLLEEALKGKPERNYWWGSPVFGQAEIGFRRMCAKLPKSYYTKNQSKLTIKLANGTTIWFKSAERPDDLYGEDVYAAVLDEASRMREEAWHAVRSTLTATRGPVRIIGNVKGRKNWFFRLARAAEAGAEGMAFHRITAWDAVEAGVLDREEIEASFRDFKRLGREGAWNQLYMAEAADDGDNPFGLAAIAACVIDGQEATREGGNSTWRLPAAGYPKAAGVDLAGRGAANVNTAAADEATDRDYTAVVMLDKDGRAIHVQRFRKAHTETGAEVAAVVKRVPALVDSTGTGDAVVEALQRRGDMAVEGFTFTERSRQDLLEGLALAVGEGSVQFPDGWLRDELDSFEFRYSSRGVRYAVPEGMHDDGAIALALVVKKMPWRRRFNQAPVGVEKAGGSVWTGGSDAAVDPLLSPAGSGEPVAPVPFAVGGGAGSSKWRGH
jgi:hypothetical protein